MFDVESFAVGSSMRISADRSGETNECSRFGEENAGTSHVERALSRSKTERSRIDQMVTRSFTFVLFDGERFLFSERHSNLDSMINFLFFFSDE